MRAPRWCREIVAQARAHGRHHVRPAGSEDPRRQVQGRQGSRFEGPDVHAGCRAANWATKIASGSTTRNCRATSRSRRGAAAGRRQDRARRHRGARRGSAHHGAPSAACCPTTRASTARAAASPRRRSPRKTCEDIRTAARSRPITSRCRSRSPAPTCAWRASCCDHPAARRLLIAKIERAEAVAGAAGDHRRLATASWSRAAISRWRWAMPRCRRCRSA